jgi:phosphoribosylformylglycinamidine synthase
MQLWLGDSAYSPFQWDRLQKKLASKGFEHFLVFAHTLYCIDATKISEPAAQTLDRLLLAQQTRAVMQYQLFIMPRLGTVSPWASKATDIAQHCGLTQVKRIERGMAFHLDADRFLRLNAERREKLLACLYDKMTESIFYSQDELTGLFAVSEPKPLSRISVMSEGRHALVAANKSLGLALSDQEIDYLHKAYHAIERDPTDAELMMFAQVNSEHCRHKIFNAKNFQEGKKLPYTLFEMIKNTYKESPDAVLSAYKDNAAVFKGVEADRFFCDPSDQRYRSHFEPCHTVLKVETHNHPTAISPFAGAATGSGGEIRDEAATGRGAVTKAGLSGFSVSHLHIPNMTQPWEFCAGKPQTIASSLQIMLEGPIGAASFNNEFGRPNLCGYFRTCELAFNTEYGDIIRGYHKPIMLAGGLGQIRDGDVQKKPVPELAKLVVLGGPAMPIGLGGGAASSVNSGAQHEDLDFASVQRSNPEMQRRAQEVINTCWAMGDDNPIISIHDVGAGGLSNALPEIVEADDKGALVELRKIPSDAPGMTPLEIWCNEAQERYVLAVSADSVGQLEAMAKRERCPMAVVGEAMLTEELLVTDSVFDDDVVHMPLDTLFEKMPPQERELSRKPFSHKPFKTAGLDLSEAITRVLQFPAVADKSFLITIGDRSITGLVARDQMVGPWQIPVSDVAVSAHSFNGFTGDAMAMGERAPIALIHHAASARMAVGEAITNIAAASIDKISDIVMSANWMAAADYPGEGMGLYDAVQAVGMELCPALGIAIPVGKDSLSMRTTWEKDGQKRSVTSPMSLAITAAAPVNDVRKTLTPQIRIDYPNSELLLLDLGRGANCLAGSALCQVYGELGQRPPDVDDANTLIAFFGVIQRLNRENKLLAYHDRSDGGLITTIAEMMFAGRAGVDLDITSLGTDVFHALFTEELGAVIQVNSKHVNYVKNVIKEAGLGKCLHSIGVLNQREELLIKSNKQELYRNLRQNLRRLWAQTSYEIQALRDNPVTAKEEYDNILYEHRVGIAADVQFDLTDNLAAPFINTGAKPQCAILREQGVNGHVEMAAAFSAAGFETVDVHMSDLIEGRADLASFRGLAVCGGFSYGDVLGAGRGWAHSILENLTLRDMFTRFFNDKKTFTLGVCNGAQMLTQIKEIIPGAESWPTLLKNRSHQFESRLLSVKVENSPSIFLQGMAGSSLPIVVAHAEGHAHFDEGVYQDACADHLIAMRYVDDGGHPTERYPYNPNGSIDGSTGFTTHDGRVTIMMPHPERVFRSCQFSWHPSDWGDDAPWLRLFRNARAWVG